jgi:hypothetical protein
VGSSAPVDLAGRDPSVLDLFGRRWVADGRDRDLLDGAATGRAVRTGADRVHLTLSDGRVLRYVGALCA